MKKNCCIFFSLFLLNISSLALADGNFRNPGYGGYAPPPMATPAPVQDYDSMPEYHPQVTPVPNVVSSPGCSTVRVCRWITVYEDPDTGETYDEQVCENMKMC